MALMRATIAILAALALLAGASTASARSHARLTLAGTQPLIVHGHGFHKRERVRVVLRSGGDRVTRHVRATRRGRFSVTFRDPVQAGPCGGLSVTAFGARGGHAVLPYVMRPACIAQ